MDSNNRKYIILGSLCALIITMTVAYAAFQANLKVKGTSKISSNWDVRIINVKESNKNGNAETVGTPTWTELTANIEANLYDKGDFIEYEVTVENRGTLDAKLDNINETTKEENKAVKISFSGYTKGQKLEKGTSQIINVKIEYNPEFIGEAEEGSTEIDVTLNYTQNDEYKKDETGEIISPERYLVKYDCTTNGGEKCTNYNEYLKEGEIINLSHKGPNKKYDFIGWNTDPKAVRGLSELQMGTEEVTLYAIYEKAPIIRSWANGEKTDFHSDAYKESIISAEFLDHKNVPENAVDSWDVSEAGDGSVKAWIVPDETDSTKHHLYIGGKGGVIANENSSNLFYVFTSVQTIDFHNNFDTSNVTNMNNMFVGSYKLKSIKFGDKFVTDNVVTVRAMFGNNYALTELDVSNFNTSNITDMYNMFASCQSLTSLNLSNFDTSKVTDVGGMFYHCYALTKLNLCSWNTNKVKNMNLMFLGSSKLTKIYVGPSWTTANASTTNMFEGAGTSSVTQSNNCMVEAEDPAQIELSTSKTSNSITVVASAIAESGIEKYEYQIDGGNWIESTENIHIFTDLEQNTEHSIKVRLTSKIGKQTISKELKVTTNVLATPTFEEIQKENAKEVTITYPEGCGDNLTCSYQKDDGEWIETTDINTKIDFTESGVLIAKVTDGNNEVTSSHTVVYGGDNLEYNGEVQTFTAFKDGYYKIELWGAQGGDTYNNEPNNGAYTSGEIYLNAGQQLYIYIGKQGDKANVCSTSRAFNNGSIANSINGKCGVTGGGATDVRLVGGNWNDATSLNSRIMVAAGGTYRTVGGDLIGREIAKSDTYYANSGKAARQRSGGAVPTKWSSATSNGTAGGFGYAGDGGASASTTPSGGGATGGSGYYGGSGASGLSSGVFAGGSGSSYISGYAGVDSITSETDKIHTQQTKHYSGKYFINTEMQAGVNSGDGKAKITYLKVPSSKDSTKIKGVRYIKDCINGNTANVGNHWTELQAINNGINVAKGKNVTGTSSANANYPYSRIVDGIMDETNLYAAATGIGTQCIIVDLEKEYDLEEIAVWHYYDDGRKYYNNSTQVAGENGIYRMIDYNDALTQTSNGNRIKNDNMLSVQDKNINIGYTRGGSIKLSSTNDTINITDTPNSNFVYQGATLVCENKNTKKISNKSFNVSDCEGDITVYPTWKRNDYTWFQQNGTNNLNLWTTSSYDAYKINLTFESTYKYVRIDGLASTNSRNVFATTSKYDLTDFKTWRTTLHCYNSSGTPFTTASGVIRQWKNIKSDYPAGWDQQNYTTNSIDTHDLNISNYNGSSYYLTLHLLVNNNTFWCGWVQNLLLGDTYSYEKPF